MLQKTSNVLQFGLNEITAKKILTDLADSRIYFTEHAEDRMVERSITRKQILRCIKHGKIIEVLTKNLKAIGS